MRADQYFVVGDTVARPYTADGWVVDLHHIMRVVTVGHTLVTVQLPSGATDIFDCARLVRVNHNGRVLEANPWMPQ